MNQLTKKWWKEAVVYQIYPRSFKDSNGDGIGDLKGIISKLDYLALLGIDVIWLSPHFDSPNADNGYDIRDYYKVMEEFGTMEDFDILLAGLKDVGIKLIIDLVVNHTSDEHRWFKQSKSSVNNPYRDYYIWRAGEDETQPPNNYPSFFGGSAWEKHEASNDYYLHYFGKKQPDLNWENEKVREEVYDIMRFWLDKGVDGFRMDVIPFISKHQDFANLNTTTLQSPETLYASGPRLHEYLHEMNQKVLSKYDVMTVGEAFGISEESAQLMTDERSNELDLVFLFDIVRIGREDWKQKEWSLPQLKKLFNVQSTTDTHHWPTLFLNNHDNPRSVNKYGNASEEFRIPSAKLLAMLLLTQRGTPFLYQGEEIGMTNYSFGALEEFDDIEVRGNIESILKDNVSAEEYLEQLNQTSRDHARTPMQWSHEQNAGFTSASKGWFTINPNFQTINVQNNLENPESILHFYILLLEIRKSSKDLIYGDYFDIDPDHTEIFAYTRTGENSKYLIVLNLSNSKVKFHVGTNFRNFELVVANIPASQNKILSEYIDLKPWEACLYKTI